MLHSFFQMNICIGWSQYLREIFPLATFRCDSFPLYAIIILVVTYWDLTVSKIVQRYRTSYDHARTSGGKIQAPTNPHGRRCFYTHLEAAPIGF